MPGFGVLLTAWVAIGLVAFIALQFVDAPYGKMTKQGWGPGIPNRLAWMLMEVVVLVSFAVAHTLAGGRWGPATTVFAGLFVLHYVNRSLIYPWRTRTRGKIVPASIFVASTLFNTVNGAFLGWDFAQHADRGVAWFTDPRFIVGIVVFGVGMGVNWASDTILIRLREPGETGYRIPHGGGFRWVSSPNLLGEIIEWAGFALLTWTPSALAFLVWTCANLVPRARANHRWYRARFPDDPPERRALVPGLW